MQNNNKSANKMNIHEKYIERCLQLAELGKGYVSPNPMVGSIIVHNGKIIGEGYHRQYGKAHAEVNAINSVKDKTLLKESTIYVSLEPCSHYGKTPPCAQLIIDSQIPEVVIATLDPNPLVSGRGVKMLETAGIKVHIGILKSDAENLNQPFFTNQLNGRPYIFLKWAQTSDGFIDKMRKEGEEAKPTPISNCFTQMLVHKKRAEVSAIMVGTNTVIKDNPSLTTRHWYGKNPLRVILDRSGKALNTSKIFDNNADTIVFTELVSEETTSGKTRFFPIKFDEDVLFEIMKKLNELKVDSILVEGGRCLLQSFIDSNLWDEAFIEVADIQFKDGVAAPQINGEIISEEFSHGSKLIHLKRQTN